MWTTRKDLPHAITGAVAATAANGTRRDVLYLVGGRAEGKTSARVVRVSTDAFGTLVYDTMPDLPRSLRSATAAMVDGALVVFEGDQTVSACPVLALDLGEPNAAWTCWDVSPDRHGGAPERLVRATVQGGAPGGVPSAVYALEPPSMGSDGVARSARLWALVRRHGRARWKDLTPKGAVRDESEGLRAHWVHGEHRIGGLAAVGSAHVVVVEPSWSSQLLSLHTVTAGWAAQGGPPPSAGLVVDTALLTTSRDLIWVEQRLDLGSPPPDAGAPETDQPASVEVWRSAISEADPKSGASLRLWDLVVVGAYLTFLAVLGLWMARRQRTEEDFLLAGRRVRASIAGVSLFATQLSAISWLGASAVAFAGDWVTAWSAVIALAVVPIVTRTFIPALRGPGRATAYQLLAERFGRGAQLYGAWCFIALQIGRMALLVYLPSLALYALTGIPVWWCIVGLGGLATIYTALGGLEAILWTDLIQAVLMIGGLIVSLALVLEGVSGLERLIDLGAAAEKWRVFVWHPSVRDLSSWWILPALVVLGLAPQVTDQTVVQRYLAVETPREAARSAWLGALLGVPAIFLIFLLGTGLWFYFADRPELLPLGMPNDQVLAQFFAGGIPVGWSGLLLAAILSASMSSFDSSVHSTVTVVGRDLLIRPRERAGRTGRTGRTGQVGFTRVLTLAVGTAATAAAVALSGLGIRSMAFLFVSILGLTSSGVLAMYLLAVHVPRVHGRAAVCGALLSTATVAFVSFGLRWNLYTYPVIGLLVGCIGGVVASAVLPSRDASQVRG